MDNLNKKTTLKEVVPIDYTNKQTILKSFDFVNYALKGATSGFNDREITDFSKQYTLKQHPQMRE
jgi:hypothetical protein